MSQLTKSLSYQDCVNKKLFSVDHYTCETCGQPLNRTISYCGDWWNFSHQRWHACQTDHKPEPLAGWLGENNIYIKSWENDLVLWLLSKG